MVPRNTKKGPHNIHITLPLFPQPYLKSRIHRMSARRSKLHA